MRFLSERPPFIRAEVADELLFGMTPGGRLPLYRYAPLQAALHSGQDVPFAHLWPEHLKLFVYTYVPVRPFGAAEVPAVLAPRFSWLQRDLRGLRPWLQATYQGWPLYSFMLDQPDRPARGEVPALFSAVAVEVQALAPPGERRRGP